MERVQKSGYVAQLKKRFEDSAVVLAVTQDKVTVAEVEKLRKDMSANKAGYYVIKNTLAKVAVKGTACENMTDLFKGQAALVFSDDSVSACKTIMKFVDAYEGKIAISGGSINGEMVSVDYIKTLSKLPSMDEIRAKIIAIIQTPGGQIARVLKAYSEK